jgi:hypothetical protein
MTITTHIHRLAVAAVLAFALLAGPAAAQSVPPSEHNARWPREPASGPLPTASPAPAPDTGNDWTLISVAAGVILLTAVTATATGIRIRVRRRVAA